VRAVEGWSGREEGKKEDDGVGEDGDVVAWGVEEVRQGTVKRGRGFRRTATAETATAGRRRTTGVVAVLRGRSGRGRDAEAGTLDVLLAVRAVVGSRRGTALGAGGGRGRGRTGATFTLDLADEGGTEILREGVLETGVPVLLGEADGGGSWRKKERQSQELLKRG
jgi:hypothetical protein